MVGPGRRVEVARGQPAIEGRRPPPGVEGGAAATSRYGTLEPAPFAALVTVNVPPEILSPPPVVKLRPSPTPST